MTRWVQLKPCFAVWSLLSSPSFAIPTSSPVVSSSAASTCGAGAGSVCKVGEDVEDLIGSPCSVSNTTLADDLCCCKPTGVAVRGLREEASSVNSSSSSRRSSIWCFSAPPCERRSSCTSDPASTLKGCTCEPECIYEQECCAECRLSCHAAAQKLGLTKNIGSCRGRCGQSALGGNCSCARGCTISGGCCQDNPETLDIDESYSSQCSTYRQLYMQLNADKSAGISRLDIKHTLKKHLGPGRRLDDFCCKCALGERPEDKVFRIVRDLRSSELAEVSLVDLEALCTITPLHREARRLSAEDHSFLLVFCDVLASSGTEAHGKSTGRRLDRRPRCAPPLDEKASFVCGLSCRFRLGDGSMSSCGAQRNQICYERPDVRFPHYTDLCVGGQCPSFFTIVPAADQRQMKLEFAVFNQERQGPPAPRYASPVYTMSYNAERLMPNWVAFTVNPRRGGLPGGEREWQSFTQHGENSRARWGSDHHGWDRLTRGHLAFYSAFPEVEIADATNALENAIPMYTATDSNGWAAYERALVAFKLQHENYHMYAVHGPSPDSIENRGGIRMPSFIWSAVVVFNARNELVGCCAAYAENLDPGQDAQYVTLTRLRTKLGFDKKVNSLIGATDLGKYIFPSIQDQCPPLVLGR